MAKKDISYDTNSFKKATVGMWAFEMDEGKHPRMYVDDIMLGLIGLDHQVSPEETYHAWYDNVDNAHLEEVAIAVDQMIAGKRAEVSYPWHYPNGKTIYVRCGGQRNFQYTNGIRIEGYHQDITDVLHFQKQEEDLREFSEIASALAGRLDEVYFINIVTGHFHLFKDKDPRGGMKTQISFSGDDFFSYAEEQISTKVHPDDTDNISNFSKKEYLLSVYSKESLISDFYRRNVNGNYVFYRTTVVKSAFSSDYIVVTIENVGEVAEKRMEEQLSTKQNLQIIDVLSSEYSSVYYIDLNNNTVIPYSMNDETAFSYGKFLSSKMSYSDAFSLYVSKMVSPEYRNDISFVGSIENVKKMLAHKKSFNYIYKDNSKNSPKYCEMKFVKPGNDDSIPNVVALGFANRDEQVCRQFVFDKMINEYASIFLVNVNKNKFRFVHKGPTSGFPYDFNGDYEKTISDYASRVCKEDQQLWNNLADLKYVKQLLKEYDKREYSYKLDGVENKWRRCVLQVIERKNGEVVSFIMSYVTLDKAEVEKRELNLKIEQQKALLEQQRKEEKKHLEIINKLADRYLNIYILDCATKTISPLRIFGNALGVNEVLKKTNDYETVIENYIRHSVVEADQDNMIKASKFENVCNELSKNPSFTYHFLVNKEDGQHYYYVDAVRLSEDSNYSQIIFGFACEDEAKAKEQLLISQLNTVNALSIDFDNACYVNIKDEKHDDVVIQFRSNGLFEKYVPNWKNITTFSLALDSICDFLVYEPDRKIFYETTRRDVIFEHLNEESVYYVNFRVLIDDEIHYANIKFVSPHQEFRNTKMFVSAFMLIDEQMKQEKERQEQLQNALKMAESANRAKTIFLSNMSHDIRTPMNAIIGFTNLAEQKINEPNIVKDYLSKIMVSGKHLLSLINDILDMSRIESGKITLNESECDLVDIMKDLNTIVYAQAESKNINLFLNTINVVDENVCCDRLRLHQVLLNLISNAIKFTPNGGNISVSIEQVNKVEGDKVGHYIFRVKDNGIGMSEEFASRIFEPFERERTSTVSKTQGTGLGMAITKSIIDLMGGNIKINTAINKGSEFVITLDMKLQDVQHNASIIDEYRRKKAFIIDDDECSRLSISSNLDKLGISSISFDDPNKAIKHLLDNNDYDFYYIDWKMPYMDGLEFINKIHPFIKETAKIIVISAYDYSDVEKIAVDIGVDTFIEKPIFLSNIINSLIKLNNAEIIDKKEIEKEKLNFAGKKVLIVEDNDLNREIASEILKEFNLVIDSVEDGIYAVDKIENAKVGDYDLVFMDVQMPIMNGYDATKAIRKLDAPLKNVPIVAMTANAFEEDKKNALDAGMNDHIAKPIEIDSIKRVLNKYLNN